MIFFGAIVATLSARVNSQVSTIRRITESVYERTLAYSGIGYVLGVIAKEEKPPTGGPKGFASYYWLDNPGLFQDVPLFEDAGDLFSIGHRGSSSNMTYGLKDEESKIGINAATEEVFKRIYASLEDLTEEDAKALAKETLKYRNQKSSFASVEEMLLVPGMTSSVFDKIKSRLTVFGTGQVNLNTVSRETLVALGIDLSLAGRIVEYRESARKEALAGLGPASAADADKLRELEEVFKNLGDLTQKIGVSPEEDTQLQNIASIWTAQSKTFRFLSLVISKDKRVKAGFECVANRNREILFLANA